MIVYCSNCGAKLPITRKAMPKYGCIVDLIPPHECTDIPAPFDLKPNPVPAFTEKQKFVEKLNELSKPGVSTEDLRDRRSAEHIKPEPEVSSAPSALIDQLKRNLGD